MPSFPGVAHHLLNLCFCNVSAVGAHNPPTPVVDLEHDLECLHLVLVEQSHKNMHHELLRRVVVVVKDDQEAAGAGCLLALFYDEIALLLRGSRRRARICRPGPKFKISHSGDRVSAEPTCRGGIFQSLTAGRACIGLKLQGKRISAITGDRRRPRPLARQNPLGVAAEVQQLFWETKPMKAALGQPRQIESVTVSYDSVPENSAVSHDIPV